MTRRVIRCQNVSLSSSSAAVCVVAERPRLASLRWSSISWSCAPIWPSASQPKSLLPCSTFTVARLRKLALRCRVAFSTSSNNTLECSNLHLSILSRRSSSNGLDSSSKIASWTPLSIFTDVLLLLAPNDLFRDPVSSRSASQPSFSSKADVPARNPPRPSCLGRIELLLT